MAYSLLISYEYHLVNIPQSHCCTTCYSTQQVLSWKGMKDLSQQFHTESQQAMDFSDFIIWTNFMFCLPLTLLVICWLCCLVRNQSHLLLSFSFSHLLKHSVLHWLLITLYTFVTLSFSSFKKCFYKSKLFFVNTCLMLNTITAEKAKSNQPPCSCIIWCKHFYV